jgi:Ca2+-binding RTX toxin-like protein
MRGGDGDGIYYVNAAFEQTTEFSTVSNPGGNDTVYASVGHSLSVNVETLILVDDPTATTTVPGAGNNFGGGGNAGNNVIIGNSGNNNLFDLGGNDSPNGGAGNDTLEGGLDNDTLVGGTGNDLYKADIRPIAATPPSKRPAMVTTRSRARRAIRWPPGSRSRLCNSLAATATA